MAVLIPSPKAHPARKLWVRPTIKQVAKRAGVAMSTVSAILSDKSYCYASEETRQRVLEAAQSLDYQPNVHSRALLGQQTYTLGLVLRDLVGPTLKVESIVKIQQLAQQRGYRLLVAAHHNNPELEANLIRSFLAQHVDGFIVEPAWSDWQEHNESLYAKIIKEGMPVVAVDPVTPIDAPHVWVDRQHGALLLARHLIEVGKRRFVFAIEASDSPLGQAKARGYRQALAEAGIDPDAQIWLKPVCPPDMALADYPMIGTNLIDNVLRSGRSFDAVATGSDSLALGVMRALSNAGLRVPEDVAVAGFHDEMFGASLPISLTTVRHPPSVDRLVFDLLMKQIDGAGAEDDDENSKHGTGTFQTDTDRRVICTPSLVVRESTTVVRPTDSMNRQI